jgi:hypothetical protein
MVAADVFDAGSNIGVCSTSFAYGYHLHSCMVNVGHHCITRSVQATSMHSFWGHKYATSMRQHSRLAPLTGVAVTIALECASCSHHIR